MHKIYKSLSFNLNDGNMEYSRFVRVTGLGRGFGMSWGRGLGMEWVEEKDTDLVLHSE